MFSVELDEPLARWKDKVSKVLESVVEYQKFSIEYEFGGAKEVYLDGLGADLNGSEETVWSRRAKKTALHSPTTHLCLP